MRRQRNAPGRIQKTQGPDLRPRQRPMGEMQRKYRIREQLEFAHMVIFSQAHQASLGGLASQCILTEVICSGEAAGYDQQDGIAILGGTPENLPETLSYLEI